MTAMLALTLALAAPPDDINLAWKLKEGDVFYNQTKMVMEQTFMVMGKEVEQSMTTETVLRYKVKSVKAGMTVVEMTYLSNKTTAKGLPGADGLNDKMKGVTLTVTLDGKMEVLKLEGYDKLLDTVSGGKDDVKAGVKALLPEATLKEGLTETFGLIPGGVTKVGGTWKRNSSLSLGPLGDVTVANTSKVDSVKDGLADVSWTATGKIKPGDGKLPGAAITFTKIDLKIEKLTGSFTFDLTAGRLKGSKSKMEMTGSLTVSANGQEVTMDVKQKLSQSATIGEKNPIKD